MNQTALRPETVRVDGNHDGASLARTSRNTVGPDGGSRNTITLDPVGGHGVGHDGANRHAARSARRACLGLVGAAVVTSLGATWRSADAAFRLPEMEIWRSPTCGCCGDWIEHLSAAGFPVKVRMVQDTAPTRQRLGMPGRYGSCHTGLVDGYVIEGHVPAGDIRRLLSERPDAIGLAVPGMPVGSPGMEMGSQRDPYDVLLVVADDAASVFASYR